jgi:sugar O-acyltransferase (sialic acid O-acetyltransferase NeuD family)
MNVVVDVVGAGGHAKVVLALLRARGHTIGRVVDADPARHGATILAHRIEPESALVVEPDRLVVVAIGNNAARQRVAERLAQQGHRFAWLVHPTAWVAPTARIEPGAVVFAGAIVQPDAVVGAHAIVNTAASIDHDCVVGAFAHVAPGSHLAGNVHVGEGAFLGVGVSVIPGRRIGAWSTVGAGAAVVHDVDEGVTVVGVPARPLLPRPTSTKP